MRPELEKQGLLSELEWPEIAGRRPADTLLVSGAALAVTSRRRFPRVALDFAAVSPFAIGSIREASKEQLATAKAYSDVKRQYKSTQLLCEEADVGFEPIVFETTGGLEPEGQKVLESILAEVALATGLVRAVVVKRFKGRISIDLCRAQHRALRRRRAGYKVADVVHAASAAEQALTEAELEVPPADLTRLMMGTSAKLFKFIRFSN